MQTEKYPFDYDSLSKGDMIAAEVVEEIVKLPRTHVHFNLRALALKQQVESELDARGRPANVRIEKGGLKILTDEEARPYSEQQFREGVRKIKRAHLRACIIDQGNLNEEDKQRLQGQILIQGAQIAAMRKAKRKLLPEAHKSDVPKIQSNAK